MEQCELHCATAGRVELRGQLTRNTVPSIWAERRNWLAHGDAALTFDMKAIEKVDSAGVAMLLRAKSALRENARDLVIINANQQFQAILKVSGVDTLLTLGE